MNDLAMAIMENTEQISTPEFALNEAALNSFLEYADVANQSIKTYKNAILQFIRYTKRNNITHPTRTDIINYKTDLLANHKPTTVQNYITAVKIFFSWTAQVGIYPNIADKLKGVKVSKEHKKDALTEEQIEGTFNCIDTDTVTGKRDYAIIMLMMTSGFRTIEISRANIEDIRTVGKQTVLYIQGKGRTGKDEYTQMSIEAETAIRAYLKARGSYDPKEPLFTSTSNNSKGNRLSTRTISGIAKARMQAAGYDSERLTAHSLRHTAVTYALSGGESLERAKQFARHADLNTTMIYNHNLDRAKNTCAATVGAAISKILNT